MSTRLSTSLHSSGFNTPPRQEQIARDEDFPGGLGYYTKVLLGRGTKAFLKVGDAPWGKRVL